METDVVCPDCGKVIAPPGAVENTLRCRCGENRTSRLSADAVPTRPNVSFSMPATIPHTKDDTDTLPAESADPTAKQEKRCYVCGAALEGRTRLKDHLGRYWCKDCAAADERAKKRAEELRCPDCGRMFPDHKLIYFQTTRVCRSCFKEREKALEKKIKKAAVEKLHDKHEWRTIKWMAIVVAVLVVLGAIGYLLHR